MLALSLFSGAGGFEIGFNRAGIRTMLQVESDPWCREVLARHWPDTQRLADVRKLDAAAWSRRCRDVVSVGSGSDAQWLRDARRWREHAARPDLIYGGWPCQDLSVAGQRAGLRGKRSGLFHEFARLVRDLRPQWLAAENVPGLLSSAGGGDFGTVLNALVDLGYGVAWRVLDGRWFGVPQRRRRVFLVGCLGDAARAAAVLAVCESCGGHPATRPTTGQGIAYTLAGGSPDTSRRIGNGWNTTYLVAFYSKGFGQDVSEDLSPPVLAADNDNGGVPPAVSNGADARRLTPLECERLMGWPDDWTRWTADGREIPDSHRYRLCGNGVIATVAEWLGHRLVWANSW